MKNSSPLASIVGVTLIAATALFGTVACKKSGGTDAAAEVTLKADQDKAQAARTAAEEQCKSLPGAAQDDCRSVAGAEYDRLMGEAKDRHDDAKP